MLVADAPKADDAAVKADEAAATADKAAAVAEEKVAADVSAKLRCGDSSWPSQSSRVMVFPAGATAMPGRGSYSCEWCT